jgi:D-sedoheptulose 7-phosphate isomerase
MFRNYNLIIFMQNDTRSKNTYFDSLYQYAENLKHALLQVCPYALENTQIALLDVLKNGGRIFVAGNGGSASISEHLTCDFMKGCEIKGDTLQTIALTNTALLTAIANDISYEDVFSYQLMLHKATSNDLLILISSSGNSANIIKAAYWAKARKILVIGMTGFMGGVLKVIADRSLHVPVRNYGIVEDCHQALMHYLAQSHYQFMVRKQTKDSCSV